MRARSGLRRLAVAAVSVLLSLVSLVCFVDPARAMESDRVATEWMRLLVRANEDVPRLLDGPMLVAPAVASRDVAAPAAPSASPRWLSFAPELTLLARDWGRTHLLRGRMPISETLRLSRSSRMLLLRASASPTARLAPFVHAGFGQWRVDTTVVSSSPSNTEIALQLGLGLEAHLLDGLDLVVETNHTVFHRDAKSALDVPATRVTRALFVARFGF